MTDTASREERIRRLYSTRPIEFSVVGWSPVVRGGSWHGFTIDDSGGEVFAWCGLDANGRAGNLREEPEGDQCGNCLRQIDLGYPARPPRSGGRPTLRTYFLYTSSPYATKLYDHPQSQFGQDEWKFNIRARSRKQAHHLGSQRIYASFPLLRGIVRIRPPVEGGEGS